MFYYPIAGELLTEKDKFTEVINQSSLNDHFLKKVYYKNCESTIDKLVFITTLLLCLFYNKNIKAD